MENARMVWNGRHTSILDFMLDIYKKCIWILYIYIYRQCLLHRLGFQHLIAAAPAAAVVFFCCSIYYLLGWYRCPNPNSNNKILEKKKDFEAKELSCTMFEMRVLRISIPQPCALQPSVLTTKPSALRIVHTVCIASL